MQWLRDRSEKNFSNRIFRSAWLQSFAIRQNIYKVKNLPEIFQDFPILRTDEGLKGVSISFVFLLLMHMNHVLKFLVLKKLLVYFQIDSDFVDVQSFFILKPTQEKIFPPGKRVVVKWI